MRNPWSTAIASGLILGFVVGIPYYSMPFFYDYFEHPLAAGGHGWSRASIQLGLPLGTLVTLFAAPLLSRRIPLKPGIVAGIALCGFAIAAMGCIPSGNLAAYYGCWMLYMFGWTFAGPMAHQVLLAQVFENNRRGGGIAISLFGISVFGAASVACVARPLTAAYGYRTALLLAGALVLLAVPLAALALPSLQRPAAANPAPPSRSWFRAHPPAGRVFWLLSFGSSFTAAGIAGVSQHLKLILAERGYAPQARLDEVFGWTVMLMLTGSALGRFTFAWLADRAPRIRVLALSFLFMLGSMPLLVFVDPASFPPYLFGAVFGFGMSSDSLLVALLAAEHYGPNNMAGPMSLIVPVNTVAQTWFPYLVTLLWAATGSYSGPLWIVFFGILGGRFLLSRAASAVAAVPAPALGSTHA